MYYERIDRVGKARRANNQHNGQREKKKKSEKRRCNHKHACMRRNFFELQEWKWLAALRFCVLSGSLLALTDDVTRGLPIAETDTASGSTDLLARGCNFCPAMFDVPFINLPFNLIFIFIVRRRRRASRPPRARSVVSLCRRPPPPPLVATSRSLDRRHNTGC